MSSVRSAVQEWQMITMIDELKQWEYDKGYEKGKADMLKVIEDIRAEIAEYKDDKIIHAEQNEMIDIMLEIIDKYKAESEV